MALAATIFAGAAVGNTVANWYQQQSQQSFENSLVDRGEKAYTSVGLPKYLYYQNGQGAKTNYPNTIYNTNGSNFTVFEGGYNREPKPATNNLQQINRTNFTRPSSQLGNNEFNGGPPGKFSQMLFQRSSSARSNAANQTSLPSTSSNSSTPSTSYNAVPYNYSTGVDRFTQTFRPGLRDAFTSPGLSSRRPYQTISPSSNI